MSHEFQETVAFLNSRLPTEMCVRRIGASDIFGYCAWVPYGNLVSCLIENHGERLVASSKGFLFRGQSKSTKRPPPELVKAYHEIFGPDPTPPSIAYTELWYVPGEGLGRLLEIVDALGFPEPKVESTLTQAGFTTAFRDILTRAFTQHEIRVTTLSPYLFSAQFPSQATSAEVKGYILEAVNLSSSYFTVELGTKRWIRAFTKWKTLSFGPM